MNLNISKKDEILLSFLKSKLSLNDITEILELISNDELEEKDFDQLYNIWVNSREKKDSPAKYDYSKGFEKFKEMIQKNDR
jgi:hypothetical protein